MIQVERGGRGPIGGTLGGVLTQSQLDSREVTQRRFYIR